MKVILTTKKEITNLKEITDLLNLILFNYNIVVKEKTQVVKKKKVKKTKKIKPKEVKIIPYREAEWLKDRMYEKEMQEEGLQQLIYHYTKIKMKEEQVI